MKRNDGFTLLETMIAIGIAGIVVVVASQFLINTQELSSMLRARNDAEKQAAILLQRINRAFLQKKPGGIIEAKKASEKNFFYDRSCDKCLTPQQRLTSFKPYSFTLHHDTEGCLTTDFPHRLIGCKGLSVASGVWTEANNCGCADERRHSTFTVITKCQALNMPRGSLFNELDFQKPNKAGKVMAECTKCPKGERPVVLINHYAKPVINSPSAGINHPDAIKQWKILPDGSLSTGSSGAIDEIGKGLKASDRKQVKSASFLSSSAVGLELCTHVNGGSVLIDINGFYVQPSNPSNTTEGLELRKVKLQTSYPTEVISNQDFRYLP